MNIKDKPTVNKEKIMRHFEQEIDWPEGSPDEIVEYMNTLKKTYNHITDLRVESQWAVYGYNSCAYCVVGYIEETDEQRSVRVRWEQVDLQRWEDKYSKHIKDVREKEQQAVASKLLLFKQLQKELESSGVL